MPHSSSMMDFILFLNSQAITGHCTPCCLGMKGGSSSRPYTSTNVPL